MRSKRETDSGVKNTNRCATPASRSRITFLAARTTRALPYSAPAPIQTITWFRCAISAR